MSAVSRLPPLLQEESSIIVQVKLGEVSLCWSWKRAISKLGLKHIKGYLYNLNMKLQPDNLLPLPRLTLLHHQTHKQQKRLLPSLPHLRTQNLIKTRHAQCYASTIIGTLPVDLFFLPVVGTHLMPIKPFRMHIRLAEVSNA